MFCFEKRVGAPNVLLRMKVIAALHWVEVMVVGHCVGEILVLPELLGVGRLIRQRDRSEAELGVVVVDKWQSAGLGTDLMRRLLQVARAERIRRIVAHILTENASMVSLARDFHFVCVPDDDPISLTATLDLEDCPALS